MFGQKKADALYVTSLLFLVSGCTAVGSKSEDVEKSGMYENQRTQSCVYGGLSLDLQFNTQSSPPRIDEHPSFSKDDAADLAHSLDPKVAVIFRDAMNSSLAATQSDQSRRDYKKLFTDFETYTVENSGKYLSLYYCGDHELVNATIYTAVTGWFGRALNTGSVSSEIRQWFGKEGVNSTNDEVNIVMFATALSVANVNYTIDDIVAIFKPVHTP